MNKTKNISAIDLFCGIGGLSYGLKKAGINIKVGIDQDKTCEYAYVKNNNADFIALSDSKATESLAFIANFNCSITFCCKLITSLFWSAKIKNKPENHTSFRA